MSKQVTTKVERGLYERGGKQGSKAHRYVAGYKDPQTGKWTMVTLKARTLTAARDERGSLLAARREGRIPAKDDTTFEGMFELWQAARKKPSQRTRSHERHLLDRHLSALKSRRLQSVTADDLSRLLRKMDDRYSQWTQVAAFRIVVAVFSFAKTRGVISESPIDRLEDFERPKQEATKEPCRLDSASLAKLVQAGGTQRWQTAIALAGYAGLRLGEVRGLRWEDIDLDVSTAKIRRALLPDGQEKETKTKHGRRTVTLLPALRRELVAWLALSPWTGPRDFVICSAEGGSVKRATSAALWRRRRSGPS